MHFNDIFSPDNTSFSTTLMISGYFHLWPNLFQNSLAVRFTTPKTDLYKQGRRLITHPYQPLHETSATLNFFTNFENPLLSSALKVDSYRLFVYTFSLSYSLDNTMGLGHRCPTDPLDRLNAEEVSTFNFSSTPSLSNVSNRVRSNIKFIS